MNTNLYEVYPFKLPLACMNYLRLMFYNVCSCISYIWTYLHQLVLATWFNNWVVHHLVIATPTPVVDMHTSLNTPLEQKTPAMFAPQSGYPCFYCMLTWCTQLLCCEHGRFTDKLIRCMLIKQNETRASYDIHIGTYSMMPMQHSLSRLHMQSSDVQQIHVTSVNMFNCNNIRVT